MRNCLLEREVIQQRNVEYSMNETFLLNWQWRALILCLRPIIIRNS